MSLVIVPNALSDAIYRKVDEAIAKAPEAAPDREYFYTELLKYFDEYGVIPEFDLVKQSQEIAATTAAHVTRT